MNFFISSSRESSSDKASTFYTNLRYNTYLHQYLLLKLNFTHALNALVLVKLLHTLSLWRSSHWVIEMILGVLKQWVFRFQTRELSFLSFRLINHS